MSEWFLMMYYWAIGVAMDVLLYAAICSITLLALAAIFYAAWELLWFL